MTVTYEVLAGLLEYPGEDWARRMSDAQPIAAADSVQWFIDGVELLSLSEVQELYTRTFDLNPACALEIGYHLFGENYKRGEFLAHLRETEAPFDLGQQHQLPDYLPVLLRLLTKLEDQELRTSLIADCLIPAIDKMFATFKDGTHPYRRLLEAVQSTLKSEPDVPAARPGDSSIPMRASLPVLSAIGLETPPELF